MQDYSSYTCDPSIFATVSGVRRYNKQYRITELLTVDSAKPVQDMITVNSTCSRTACRFCDNPYTIITKTCNQAGKRV